ncbi:MAG: hypothetical protein AB1649_16290 [Chloroflexota bacterium]
MSIFVIQLIGIIVAAVAFFLLVLDVIDVAVPHVGDPDDFWTKSHSSGTHFRMPVTFKSLILIGIIAAGLAALQLTHFDLCSFLRFWFTETQTLLPPSCR